LLEEGLHDVLELVELLRFLHGVDTAPADAETLVGSLSKICHGMRDPETQLAISGVINEAEGGGNVVVPREIFEDPYLHQETNEPRDLEPITEFAFPPSHRRGPRSPRGGP
jgi:hypothetical protein